jgi:putative DNA primase/helicase
MAASRRAKLRVVDTSDDNPTGDARPVVQIHQGRRSEAIDAAEEHLIERDPGLFQRGDFVVRVAPQEIDIGGGEKALALRIVTVGPQHLRNRFNLSVDLRKFDKRAESWVSVDCPTDFAEAYLERVGLWKLPMLSAVATAPTLRPDGSLIDRPGWDPPTGVYYDPRGVAFPAVPRAPTRAEALAALDRLDGLIGSLDFVDEVSRSVALSAILTPLLRRAMTAAPMHGITAPVAGSGKSKIVDIAAILATGHPAPVTALGQRDEETEKRLGAALLAGDLVIAIDNAERAVGGEFLCQAVTQPLIATRVLGTSTRLITSNTAAWFATGNNLKFAGDMVRRSLMCRLDPGVERPELREFETPDPCVTALADRPQFVIAALTIARAFMVAGCPRAVGPLGSFGDWSRWVRDPLIWLGRPDPVDAMAETRRDDPVLSTLIAVVEQWGMTIGERRVTGREVAELAGKQDVSGKWENPDFREALLAVAGEAGSVTTRRLGRWLSQVKGRAVGGKRLVSAEMLHGVARWQLVAATGF